ncbi:MAG: SDR family NAD(P)-dependent oxidoreductase [Bacteroidetes bacterium]|nr:SDR family NAD(P)-dependent oxidoreductase [Bacteroidota bacterium]
MNGNVIIIGATSGIGKNLALLFAEKGYHVVATGRRKNLLDELAKENQNIVSTSCFDITSENALKKIDDIILSLGKVDIFIYCAGIAILTTYPDWSSDQQMIRLNIEAFTKCSGFMFNYFLQQGYGQMVVISSIAALRGGGSAPVYNASKAFQSHLFESFNIQALQKNKNIVFTDIKPGYVDTKMAVGENKFWVMPVEKTCEQIYKAILHRKREAVVTNRWKMAAFILKFLPGFLFFRLVKKNANH